MGYSKPEMRRHYLQSTHVIEKKQGEGESELNIVRRWMRLLCVSIRTPSPPDSSFLHVCLLSFLNLLSLPVRFPG
jgi:hypothetical protein